MVAKHEIIRKKNIKEKIGISILLFIIILIALIYCLKKQKEDTMEVLENFKEQRNEIQNSVVEENGEKIIKLDWELTLVNEENKLPEDYELNLEDIDSYRKFDSRAITYLQEMIDAMRKDNVVNVWVQSSYRSIEDQEQVYNRKIEEYINQGRTQQEAIMLTERVINKPGYSEHNLGLAVDFNYVNEEFENTIAFEWLKVNAEDYGFILRYTKEKENITKVDYEPWHWRYVGKENAKRMNELNMCLEEYIEFLKR